MPTPNNSILQKNSNTSADIHTFAVVSEGTGGGGGGGEGTTTR